LKFTKGKFPNNEVGLTNYLHKGWIFKDNYSRYNKNLLKDLRETINIRFHGKMIKGDDIDFGIVMEGGAYDLEPDLPFQY
jgi:hypothetical protein